MDSRTLRRVAIGLFGLEVVFTVLDLLFGGLDSVHSEERFNARAAVQVACGHLDALLEWRDKPWCGGCVAEALAAAPLFRLFGPTVLVWKVVPATLHLIAVGAGAAIVWKRGWSAVIAWLLLVLAAPPAWRVLALRGWGTHADSLALMLGAAALVMRGRPLLAGVAAGVGAWFCSGTLVILPALIWRDRRVILGLCLGASLFFLPGFRLIDTTLELAPIGALGSWLAGPFATSAWWTDHPEPWAAAWLAVLVLLTVLARNRLVTVTLLAFLAASMVTHSLWVENVDSWANPAFELRYRTIGLTLLMLGAAMAPRRTLPLLLPVIATGLWVRLESWDGLTSRLGLRVYELDDSPDHTVPHPVALTWFDHQDAFEECATHHEIEAASRGFMPPLPKLDDCGLAGREWVGVITNEGGQDPIDRAPEPCGPSYWVGAADGWAHWVGCSEHDRAELEARAGQAVPELDGSCARWRTQ